jgi:hypothetical protein
MATLTIDDVDPTGTDYDFTVRIATDSAERQRTWTVSLPPEEVEGLPDGEVITNLWLARRDEFDSWVAANEGAAALEGTSRPYGDVAIPEWSGDSVAYEVGDRVVYEGTIYECIQAHTSQADWQPPAVPVLFDPID